MVRDVTDGLITSPPGVPVIIGVDDAPLLDELSVFVLHQIVQRHAATLVLTVRTGEQIPLFVQELWKAADFARLDLQPLSREETIALASARLGGTIDADTAHSMWRLTRGNVLYLRNIVEHAVSDGRLVRLHGAWRWVGEQVVPLSLIDLIETRLGALPTGAVEVLDVLSVGEPLPLRTLTALTSSEAIEQADTRGLIAFEAGGHQLEVRVGHPLYGEVRLRRAPPMRLRRLRRLIADELATLDDGDDIQLAVRRAALILDSDADPQPQLFLRAAKGAVWLADHRLADRLASAAIDAGAGLEAKVIRTQALSWLGRPSEAEAVFGDIDCSEISDELRGAIVFARAANMLVGLGDPVGARKLIDEFSDVAGAGARPCVDAFLTVYWAAMGKPQAALELSRRFALDQLPDAAGALPAMMLVIALGDTGRTSEAVGAAEDGYAAVSRSLDASGMRSGIAYAHTRAMVLAGRIPEANEVADRLTRWGNNLPGSAQLLDAAAAGRAALGTGRLDTACALLEPVVEMLSLSPQFGGIEYQIQPQLAIAFAMRGLTEQAAATLEAVQHRRHGGWRYLDCEYGIAQAWVMAAQGAMSQAIRTLMTAAELAGGNGQYAPEVMCLQTAVQFGEGSVAGRLRELEGLVEGPRVGVAARFAQALARDDGQELRAVSLDFEEMGDMVAAADAAAHAAMANRRRDLRGSALDCSVRAKALGKTGGGVRTPALRQVAEPLPLTSREREIAMLLRNGLSTPEIAGRLTLSKRTVEGHIFRAMGKTGTSSRSELAALLTDSTD
jgi:DNA-binding CsgD family transcriptional regulator